MSFNLSNKVNNLTNLISSTIPSSGVGVFNNLTATTASIPTLSSNTISSGTLTCGNITGTQTFNLSSGIGISTDGAGQIGMLLTTPNASRFTVGQSVYIQGTDNGYFNNKTFVITIISLPNILQTNNPYGIPPSQYGAGGTVSSGSITTLDLTATNLNGKLNVVGATNNSGNLLLCNNTTNTTGNYDLLTDSNQHLKFTATNNVLTVGGATNGSIVVPSTAGFITVNKVSSNTTTALTLESGNNSNIVVSAIGTGVINFLTNSTTRASITANGIVSTKLANLGNNNVFLEAYYAGANPALIFNANSYDNINMVGRYMTINQSGMGFYDGKSTGETLLCGVNNLSFYLNNCGYLLTGGRYNSLVSPSPAFAATDFVIYPNGGGLVGISTLGTNVVYSNGGRLSNTGPSDKTLKENINSLNSQLENVLKLRPVSFNWIDKAMGDKLCNGFIAQEVQEINDISNLVSTFKDIHDKEKLGFDIVGLIPFIVKAVQEQNELIVNQQKQIDELKLLVEKLLNK